MFTSYPTYDRYMALQRLTPMLHNEAVFALQTALVAVGLDIGSSGADGYLGNDTSNAIKAYQRSRELLVDGKAGQKTQVALATQLAEGARALYNLPNGLLYGQLQHESSMWLGNYSELYTTGAAAGTYDAGVAQRNTKSTPASSGFNVPHSIDACAQHCREYFDKYSNVKDVARRWALAAGAWNAPSWTDRLAAGGTLSATNRDKIEAYMASVTAYMVL